MMTEANWVASCVSVKCHGHGCRKKALRNLLKHLMMPFGSCLWLRCEYFYSIRLCHSIPTRFQLFFLSLHHRTREIETPIDQKSIRRLTFLILTFEEGISLVVSNFGFDQLHKNVVPPFALLLARALNERWPIGRLYEDRICMASDLFGISHFDDIWHVDAGLRYRLDLWSERNDKNSRLISPKKIKSSRIN